MPNTKKMLKQHRLKKSIRVKNKILKGGAGLVKGSRKRPQPRAFKPKGNENAFTPSSTPSSSISSITEDSRTGTIGSESNASFASKSIEGDIQQSSPSNNGPYRMFGQTGTPTPESSTIQPAIKPTRNASVTNASVTTEEPIKPSITIGSNNSTVKPEGNATQQAINATKPQGNVPKPEDPIKPEGNAIKPEGNVTKLEEPIKPEGNIPKPAINSTQPEGNVTKPNVEQLKKVMNEFASITEELSSKIKKATSNLTGEVPNQVASKQVVRGSK
jgi:hypothetical protein